MLRILNWNLAGKRVFLRADLNTHLHHALFEKSLKFNRLLPTLYFLKEHGARVTLATHIARPEGYDPAYSTEKLTDHFIKAGFSCRWTTLETMHDALDEDADILLLENLRFYSQESWGSREFAKKITQKCNFFIEDGFGAVARNETSIITAAELFNLQDRSIGFLIKDELEHLQPLRDFAKKPYMVMVGGGKGSEKLETLYRFFDRATHIALCPGLSELPEAAKFVHDAQKMNITVLMPLDYIMLEDKKISIGPKTFTLWQPIIMSMQTIVYNGMMGMLEYPETTTYTQKIFELLPQLKAQSVIAGGDTTAAAQLWNVSSERIFLSTGGGSTLTYLSDQNLPGLTILF